MRRRLGLRIAVRVVLVALLVGPLIAGCSGKKKKTRLKGERISVLAFEQTLQADPRLATVQVRLPKPYVNEAWPLGGGYPTHAMHHLALGRDLKEVWRASIGVGNERSEPLVSPPVVADGRVYTLDAEAMARAFDAETGRRLWSVKFKRKGEKKAIAFGGGIAFDDGRVYITTGYGFAVALDAASGAEVWRTELGVSLRGTPTIKDGRVFLNSYDNQLFALDAGSGKVLWYHVAVSETAGMLGTASAAVFGDTVVGAFSSGELVALRVENGRLAWSDTLTRTGRMTPLATISDIDGDPVIDRGRVYAISHSGRFVAIDLRSGERVWERNIGGIQTPWIAGEFIYLVTTDNEVVCLSRNSGRVRWVRELQRFENENKKKNTVFWAGPVLAGDRLIVVSSHGFALSISPYTGEILGAEKIAKKVFISPIVADQTLYILTNGGRLIAMR